MISKYLARDLKLELIIDAMSNGDEKLKNICKTKLLAPINNSEEINVRQGVLKDVLKNQDSVTYIYQRVTEYFCKIAAYDEYIHPKNISYFPVSKKVLIYSEIALLYVECLQLIHKELKNINGLKSEYCINFINEFTNTYSKDFLVEVEQELKKIMSLKENSSVVIGGHFGIGMKLTDIKMHEIIEKSEVHKPKRQFIFSQPNNKNQIILDDSALGSNVKEMIDAGLQQILKTISNFVRKMRSFFEEYKEKFSFYAGAINLYNILNNLGIAICYPTIKDYSEEYKFDDLIDTGLVLKGEKAVPNSISAKSKKLWIITGANQGGKTTFLRSIGLAQLMAQAGLFVTAKSFECSVYQGIYTHFPDEEDATLNNGLLEKELKKIDLIIKNIKQGSMLLMNESFATTTEFDGCCLAEEIVSGLCKCNIMTLFVTHNYTYSFNNYQKQSDDTLFLSAGRNNNGERNYLISEGKPLKSSYALDLYDKIINEKT